MIGHNLNLSNERNISLRPRVVVHDVGTVGYVGSWERFVYLGGRFVSMVQC